MENNEWKVGCVVIILVVLVVGIVIGPSGCNRYVSSWKASAYGSDWLVVQYSQSGGVINHWELKGRSVGSEENSDGIYFKDNDGNIVHLSGHYIYIQVVDFEAAKKKYLKEELNVL
jgi:hypothetical protein